jgi:hypothetical protein
MSTITNTTVLPSSLPAEISPFDRAMNEIAEQRAADDAVRNDELLRLKMTQLVEHVGQLIELAAAEVALARMPSPTPWDEELEANNLLWLLAEFVVQAELPHDENEAPILSAHQLTAKFARSWFNVGLNNENIAVIKE